MALASYESGGQLRCDLSAMTLTIHKLSTRCRSPRGFERPGALVDDVARGSLASELAAHLGPSLDRLPAVARLKQLRVRLKIPSRNLNAMNLADAWARAFTLATSPSAGLSPGRRRNRLAPIRNRRCLPSGHAASHRDQGSGSLLGISRAGSVGGFSPAEAALGVLLKRPEVHRSDYCAIGSPRLA